VALPRPLFRRIISTLAFLVPAGSLTRIKGWLSYFEWCSSSRKFAAVGNDCFLRSCASIHNPHRIYLGDGVTAQPGLILEAFTEFADDTFEPCITLGNGVTFGHHCHIGCINAVTIENDVLIASHVFISDHSHGNINSLNLALPPIRRKLYSKGPVHIRARVWIGEGACILSGVTIGENAIIGAHAVVTQNVPANTVVAGSPARIIKQLTKESFNAS